MEEILIECFNFLKEKTGSEYDFKSLWQAFGKVAVEKKVGSIQDINERMNKKDELKKSIKKLYVKEYALPSEFFRTSPFNIVHYPDGERAYSFDKEFKAKDFQYENYLEIPTNSIVEWLKANKAKQETGRNFWLFKTNKPRLVELLLEFIGRKHLLPVVVPFEKGPSSLDPNEVSTPMKYSRKRVKRESKSKVFEISAIVSSRIIGSSTYFTIVWKTGEITEEPYEIVREMPIALTAYYRAMLMKNSNDPFNLYKDEKFPNVAKFCQGDERKKEEMNDTEDET